ncbi:hypothetical protein EDD21DRAFT_415742 [Dissophora ornata]|nr:hypothetical protein EDD21DRAFT_415742 [Dissophora ornata]
MPTISSSARTYSSKRLYTSGKKVSGSWTSLFKKRHQISHCQLHEEAASVSREATVPGPVEIRELCSQYMPDNTYDCDETGMYLKELDTKSYAVLLSTSSVKAVRTAGFPF